MAARSRCRFSSAFRMSSRWRAPALTAFSHFSASLRALRAARVASSRCRATQHGHASESRHSPADAAAGAAAGGSWSSSPGISSSVSEALEALSAESSAAAAGAASGSARPGMSSSVSSSSDATWSKRE